jgi:hypothetical protein
MWRGFAIRFTHWNLLHLEVMLFYWVSQGQWCHQYQFKDNSAVIVIISEYQSCSVIHLCTEGLVTSTIYKFSRHFWAPCLLMLLWICCVKIFHLEPGLLIYGKRYWTHVTLEVAVQFRKQITTRWSSWFSSTGIWYRSVFLVRTMAWSPILCLFC